MLPILRVGKYNVFVGSGAKDALGTATSIDPAAKAYVVKWLKDAYVVELKK